MSNPEHTRTSIVAGRGRHQETFTDAFTGLEGDPGVTQLTCDQQGFLIRQRFVDDDRFIALLDAW